jgi:hypothetical protein
VQRRRRRRRRKRGRAAAGGREGLRQGPAAVAAACKHDALSGLRV